MRFRRGQALVSLSPAGQDAAMSAPTENRTQTGRSALAAGALLALAVIAAHLPRAFFDLPLYASDEGAYLLQALHGDLLRADPQHAPAVAQLDNVVFFWIVRLFWLLPGGWGLDALRIAGGLAYVGGLALAWKVAAKDLARPEAAGLLLLALIYPFYRFVFTALPEGWYVGLLGGMILLTAGQWRRRPLIHAGGFGALAAILILIKPHGVAVLAAGLALVMIDAVLDRRRRLGLPLLRGVVMILTALAAGHALRWIGTGAVPGSLFFFGQGFYATTLGARPGPEAFHSALTALYAMIMAALLLAGPPIALGIDDLLRRRRSPDFRPGAGDLAYLLALAAFAASIAMVAIFAFKVSTFHLTETYRLWGRYFEFYVPLLWVTGWPAIRRSINLPDRGLLAAGTSFAGLVGLTIATKAALTLFPWDAAALNAFFMPTTRWAGSSFPSYAIAAGGVLVALALTRARAPLLSVWQGLFALLAVLAIGQEGAWLSQRLPASRALVSELDLVSRSGALTRGPSVAFVDNVNLQQDLLLRLRAGPRVALVPEGQAVREADTRGFVTVIVQNGRSFEGDGWRILQRGSAFTVYGRK